MTATVLIVLLVIAALAFGAMTMRRDAACNATPRARPGPNTRGDAAIDPDDDHQVGLLVGMTAGTVTDAAVARSALRRFEEERGRRATTADLGIVVGMMRATR